MLAAIGLSLPLAAQAAEAPTSRNFPVAAFDSVQVDGPYNVHIRTGTRSSVRARGAKSRIDKLMIEVHGQTLYITSRSSGWFGWPSSGTVDIDVALPTLTEARLVGSGDVDIDRVRGGSFTTAVSGSGNLSVAQLATASMAAKVTGSGNLTVRGQTGQAKTEVTGSGNFEGGGLAVQQLTANLTGSGGITVGPTRKAQATLLGSGDIRIAGRPTCTTKKTGSGDIFCGDGNRID
jgi:hypothetical protein